MKTTDPPRMEVFVSDRLVGFHPISIPSPPEVETRILSGGESPLEIELMIQGYFTDPGVGVLILQAEDVEASWNTYLANFDVVEAAGGLVLDDQGRLLMIHRYGKWDLPKGKLEQDEAVESGAIREVVEECGIRIDRLIRPIPPSHHTYIHKGRKCLKRTHWFIFSGGGAPVPQEEEGILAAEWLDAAQVKQALKQTYSSIIRVVSGAFPGGEFS